MARVFIIGNGPIEHDHASAIDAADHVIRFNNAIQHDGKSGTRTDSLFLANSRASLDCFIDKRTLEDTYAFAETRFVVLPKNPIAMTERLPAQMGRRHWRLKPRDWSRSYADRPVEYFGRCGKHVVFLSAGFFEDCCAELVLPKTGYLKQYPSTGFMGVYYALKYLTTADEKVAVLGFDWTGHDLHPWQRERAWMISNARILLVDLDEI